MGDACDSSVHAPGLNRIAALDERHQVLRNVFDALVVAGTHFGIGLIVFLRENVRVHICADYDHGNRKSLAEHISI